MKAFPEGVDHITIEEKHVIRRLQVKNLFSYLLQSLNLERGWLFSLKQLFLNPGAVALDYIGKGRLRYISPFKMLFITTTLAFLAIQYTGTVEVFAEGVADGAQDKSVLDLFEKASEYFNVLLWIYIPIAATFSWLLNRKKSQLNYAENLAYHTYFFVVTNIISLISLFDKLIYESVAWSLVMFALLTFYNTYTYKVFFDKKWFFALIESIVLFIFCSFIHLSLLIGLAIIYSKSQFA